MNAQRKWLQIGLLSMATTAWLHAPTVQAAGCSDARLGAIEQQVMSGDGEGHGPDIGSDEWQSVIEFKLGVRGMDGVPARDSSAWCDYVEKLAMGDKADADNGPSFDCTKAKDGSIESTICADAGLSALDRKLAEVYGEAAKRASNEQPPTPKAEQRGWIKGRDECWKSDDKPVCIREEYQHRIVELQARYRLVPSIGPVFYACEGNRANGVVVTFFETEPPTLIAECGDSTSLMTIQRSASGTRYEGGNESFWEHQGEARIQWGYDAPEMTCEKVD